MREFVHPLGMTQRLAVADLTKGGVETLRAMAQGRVALAYSDPPWNPGNEKWWRRHAGVEAPESYDVLLDAWCRAVSQFGPEHILCEQSANEKHRDLLLAAVAGCPSWPISTLPLLERWTVYYGSPGSRSCSRPNVLLHFGLTKLGTDPSGLSGVPMTRKVFEGLDYPVGTTVADPCMGKGMTSRLAHEKGWHVIGTELNPKRLDYTIKWILRNGYEERRHA